MREPAPKSMTPDRARAQYVDHLGGCARCRNARGLWRRPCKSGRRLDQQQRRVSRAAIDSARRAC